MLPTELNEFFLRILLFPPSVATRLRRPTGHVERHSLSCRPESEGPGDAFECDLRS